MIQVGVECHNGIGIVGNSFEPSAEGICQATRLTIVEDADLWVISREGLSNFASTVGALNYINEFPVRFIELGEGRYKPTG